MLIDAAKGSKELARQVAKFYIEALRMQLQVDYPALSEKDIREIIRSVTS